MENKNHIINLWDFLDKIQKLFDTHILINSYSVKCEVSRFKQVGTYFYFDLVEYDEDWKIKAKIKWNLFDISQMYRFLKWVSISDPVELIWKKIVINWKANFHKDYWFSFSITSFDIEYFLWDALLQKQKIIEELWKLNLLTKNKNLKYSFPPFNIALISSENSEWLKDFVAILNNEKVNYSILPFYTNIHGDKSIPDILKSINSIIKENNIYRENNLDWNNKENKFDFIAIVRWWGGSEWMNWANNIDIVKLLANVDIPIITAIWHTSDNSLLDMIAKFPCKTPSEWAKIIINIFEKYHDSINDYNERINSKIIFKILQLKSDLKQIFTNIDNQVNSKIIKLDNELNINYKSITSNIKEIWYFYKTENIKYYQFINTNIQSKKHLYQVNLNKFYFIFNQISTLVDKESKELDLINYKISSLLKSQINNLKNNLNQSYKIIQQNDYKIVLNRGYSLVLDENNKVAKQLDIWWEYLLKTKYWDYNIKVK